MLGYRSTDIAASVRRLVDNSAGFDPCLRFSFKLYQVEPGLQIGHFVRHRREQPKLGSIGAESEASAVIARQRVVRSA